EVDPERRSIRTTLIRDRDTDLDWLAGDEAGLVRAQGDAGDNQIGPGIVDNFRQEDREGSRRQIVVIGDRYRSQRLPSEASALSVRERQSQGLIRFNGSVVRDRNTDCVRACVAARPAECAAGGSKVAPYGRANTSGREIHRSASITASDTCDRQSGRST